MKKLLSLLFVFFTAVVMLFAFSSIGLGADSKSELKTEAVTLKNTESSVTIKWSKCKQADRYIIYRKSGDGKLKAIATVEDSLKFSDSTAKAGTKYTYAVRPCRDKTKGVYTKSTIMRLEKPELVKIQNAKDGIKITWKKCVGAEKYKVYRKAAQNGSWKSIGSTKKDITSFTDKKAESGKSYIYTVRAVSGDFISAYDSNGLTLMKLDRPVIFQTVCLADGIRIKWNKVDGAQKFAVYRKSKTEEQKKIAVVTDVNRYYDKTAKEGVTYTYTVKAFGGKTKSALSAGESYKFIPAVKLASAKNVTEGVSVKWKTSDYATGYIIYRKEKSGSSFEKIATVNGKTQKSYTDKKAVDGNTYYYSVTAFSGKYVGSYDKNGLSVKFIAAPKEVTAKAQDGNNLITWKKTDSATKYYIYRKADGGKWSKIKETTALQYTDTKIKSGVSYSYRIKATVKEKYFSGYSESVMPNRIDPSKKMIALTYDDGPSNSVTNRILDVLEKYDSKATFFVIGSRVDTYSSSLIRAYKMGCEIGNHTYTHVNLPSYSDSEILSEVNKTNSVVKKYTGEAPTIIRAPGGATSQRVRNTVNMPFIHWSVDTRDWEHRNAAKTVSNIKNNVRDGSIILMHDIYSATAEASEKIIPWLIEQGYQLVTVSELMEYRGKNMTSGNTYYNAYK